MVSSKGSQQTLVRQAVDELLQCVVQHSSDAPVAYSRRLAPGSTLSGITSRYRRTIRSKPTHSLRACGHDYSPRPPLTLPPSHASRYFELYLPGGSIEIAHTSRYSHRTGKSELCILATRPLAPGNVISELKGSMANLTEEEDKELKRTGGQADGVGIRRDFSVIHSKQLKKNHLFLGPARFVNVSRTPSFQAYRTTELMSNGSSMTVIIMSSFFAKAATSHSALSSP